MFDFFDSDDMERLSRAIDARCRELKISPEGIDGQTVASQLLGLFQSGVTDEAELASRPIPLELSNATNDGAPHGQQTLSVPARAWGRGAWLLPNLGVDRR